MLVIEKTNKLGKKILMSGGGRCNFTNLSIHAEHFLCQNPHFVKSALAQYTQWDFIDLVERHGIAYHEKSQGQLFCDTSAKEIVRMLVHESEAAGVQFALNTEVIAVESHQSGYSVSTASDALCCESLIVATGGLSIPTLGGASGLGYQLAEQFGLVLTERTASLVPLTLSGVLKDMAAELSGVSLPVTVSVPAKEFKEDLLFTHRGLSGPAILQLSNYWQLGHDIELDLAPDHDQSSLTAQWLAAKRETPNAPLSGLFVSLMPKALAQALLTRFFSDISQATLQALTDAQLEQLATWVKTWRLKPSGTEGYRTAEVTKGGVCVDRISSKTFECRDHPGLYFIGEVLDVTGHLGGYNFQWAWSSGVAAGRNA